METHLKSLLDDRLLEKHLIATCEYFCRMTSSQLKSSVPRELCWLSLAQVLRKCNADMLKKISSRIQKRIVDLGKQPITVGSAHFVCAVLSKLPSLKRFNSEAFCSILGRMVDFSVERKDEELSVTVAHAFSLYADDESEDIVLSSLRRCLSDSIDSESSSPKKINFATCQLRIYRSEFASVMFRMHSEMLAQHPPGLSICINEWFDAARTALRLKVEKLTESVFAWLETLILHAGSNVKPVAKQITSLFVDFLRPSDAYFNAFRCFYTIIGPPSASVSFLPLIVGSAEQPWHLQKYAKSYATAVAALLESKTYLLKPQEVVSLQQKLCKEALRYRDSPEILRLLAVLLSVNHELIPTPIQLAQSIFSKECDNIDAFESVEYGRSLCASISRPKAHLIPHLEKWNRKMEDVFYALQKEQTNEASGSMNYTPKRSEKLIDVEPKIPAKTETLEVAPPAPTNGEPGMSQDEKKLQPESASGKDVSESILKRNKTSYDEESDDPEIVVTVGENDEETSQKDSNEKLNVKQKKNLSHANEQEDDDIMILEDTALDAALGVLGTKRKLVDVWSDKDNWDPVPPKVEKKNQSAGGAASNNNVTEKTGDSLTADEMLEDLYLE